MKNVKIAHKSRKKDNSKQVHIYIHRIGVPQLGGGRFPRQKNVLGTRGFPLFKRGPVMDRNRTANQYMGWE